MRLLLAAATVGITWLGGAQAVAQPCFNKVGREIVDGCNNFQGVNRKNGDIIGRDEDRNTIASVIVVEGKKPIFGEKAPDKFGIRAPDGRVLAPPQFDSVYIVSRTLGVGEVGLNPKKSWEKTAFLVDLKTGEMRATPYSKITPTFAMDETVAPFLLGSLPGSTYESADVAVLYPTGEPTKVQVSDVNLRLSSRWVTSEQHSLIKIPSQIMTALGETPAGGKPIHNNYGFGWFAEIGAPPKEVQGVPGPLLAPLDSAGQAQSLPPDVLGMVWGGPQAMWVLRRTPQGVRFFRHAGGKPVLAAMPASEPYLALHVENDTVVARNGAGWTDPNYGKVSATVEEAVSASRDYKKVLMAEAAEKAAREAQQRAEQQAAATASRGAELALTRSQIEQAKRENWQGGKLWDLQRKVLRHELEEDYAAAGLYVDANFKREACWFRHSSICDAGTAPSSSGSGFVSTWEQAFDNARALNQRQGAENCAAALMGASRICTLP